MKKLNEEEGSSSIPPILEEMLQRRQGVVILSGLRDSSLDETVNRLLFTAKNRLVKVLQDPEQEAGAEADVLLLEGTLTSRRVEQAIEWSEEGRLVVLLLKTPNVLIALRRLLSFSWGESREHVVWRFFEQCLVMAAQMRIPTTVAGESLEAFEIVLITPQLRQEMQTENLLAVEESLKSGDETSGTVSFNQSLLQLLLRRRIDIKTAFEVTRDPVHLDQLLKRVGI